jgi:hypothetical protein
MTRNKALDVAVEMSRGYAGVCLVVETHTDFQVVWEEDMTEEDDQHVFSTTRVFAGEIF